MCSNGMKYEKPIFVVEFYLEIDLSEMEIFTEARTKIIKRARWQFDSFFCSFLFVFNLP